MYKNFEKVLRAKGLKSSDVCRATGIASSSLSEWKSGKSTPKIDKISAIADFLEVSIDYLVTGKDKYITAEEQSLLALYRKLNREDRNKIVSNIEFLLSSYIKTADAYTG